ncbi:hypothetical protein TrVFT333_001925 [Trichoderma virens FT-333]|nr:hypothetical protein TrVFT333_001925 [Trichoderma virens FT-333]
MTALECTCGRIFRDKKALREHRKAKAHHICHRCNKCFRSNKEFTEHQALRETCWQNPVKDMQWHCYTCGEIFDSQAASDSHIEETGHVGVIFCNDCPRLFKTWKAVLGHIRDKVHPEPFEPSKKSQKCNYEYCHRTFKDRKALRQHLKSVVHHPIWKMPCMAAKIGGVECNAYFSSPSAMVAHLEKGKCRSGMDRQKLNRLLFPQDNENRITNSSSTSEASGWVILDAEQESVCSGVMTPTTDSGEDAILAPSSSQLDSMSLAGKETAILDSSAVESTCTELPADRVYMCLYCPGSERRFDGKASLEQHMISVAHASRMFNYPPSLFQGGSGGPSRARRNFEP